MCNCKNATIGGYENQVAVYPPKFVSDYFIGDPCSSPKERIPIDACLVSEVRSLWSMGIVTTGCCCGHNINPPYIGVIYEHIEKMKALGYEVAFNQSRPNDEDSFTPKTLLTKLNEK